MGIGVGIEHLPDDSNSTIAADGTLYDLLRRLEAFDPLPEQGWLVADPGGLLPGRATGPGKSHRFGSPEREETAAPDEPTVYTDGSIRPTRPAWATHAAIEIYWPMAQPTLADADWIQYGGENEGNERALEHNPWGLTARCIPVAARPSSTRVEAQGVLIAAAHPGPQHILTDNWGAVLKWNHMLNLVRHNRLAHYVRRKPWGLRADGDVWAAVATLAAQKGPNNIRVTWTKGHATEDDVRQGICTDEQRRCNEIADLLAGSAHSLQPAAHERIRLLASARWSAAKRVVRAAHLFIRSAILERRALRRHKTLQIQQRRDQAQTRRNLANAQQRAFHCYRGVNGEP